MSRVVFLILLIVLWRRYDIYSNKSRAYWTALDEEMRAFTAQEGMPYLRDNDQHRSDFGRPPVVVNYFYHEEVRKSAKK